MTAKRNISIGFVDCGNAFNPTNNYIYNILKDKYNVEIVDDPEYLFYASFGQNHLGFKNAIKIFFTAENVRPDFNEADYAIAYDRIIFGDRYHRNTIGIKKSADISVIDNERKFCNFIYFNDHSGIGTKIRMDFCKKLSKYKTVDCPGKVLNNMKSELSVRHSSNWGRSKLEFIRNYKFTIAFENSSSPGYITEKLQQPLIANSIPIYWGAPDVALDFNAKGFINCHDFANFDDVIEYIIYLDNNNEAYLEMVNQPPMHPDFDFENDKLDDFIINIIENGTRQAKDPRGVWAPTHHYNQALNRIKHDILIPLTSNSDSKTKNIIKNIEFATLCDTNLSYATTEIAKQFYHPETLNKYFSLISENNGIAEQRLAVFNSVNARICKNSGRLSFSPDKSYENLYKELFAILRPYDAENKKKVRIGGNSDGGYVMFPPEKGSFVYSCGKDHTQWNKDMADMNCIVLNFCADYSDIKNEKNNVFYVQRNLVAGAVSEKEDITLAEVLRKFNHESINNIILQIDVEGKEWEFFDNIDTVHMQKFSQIVGEFHGLADKHNLQRYKRIFNKIIRTHIPIHFHYNNYGPIICFEDFLVSNLFEISFLRRDLAKFISSKISYPTDLDYPNLQNIPEVHIGKFETISLLPMDKSLPNEFDPLFYKSKYYNDGIEDCDATRLFYTSGISKGQAGSKLCNPSDYLQYLKDKFTGKEILELGPGHAPRFTGDNVSYFDICDREGLIARSKKYNLPISLIPKIINYVDKHGNLRIIDKKFDLIFSSHNLEHVVDLIQHFKDLRYLLNSDGMFACIVPDRNYTFDYFRHESTLDDVIDQHFNRTSNNHPLSTWFQCKSLLTHNDCKRHWAGDHGSPRGYVSDKISDDIAKYLKQVNVCDMHRWVFTYDSFIKLCNDLTRYKLIPFKLERIYNVLLNNNTFSAIFVPTE